MCRGLDRESAKREIVHGFVEPLSRKMGPFIRAWISYLFENKWTGKPLLLKTDDVMAQILEVENPVTRKLRIYSKSTISIGRQWCTQMSSESWVDISDFLCLKKGEMTDYDYGDKKLMIANIGGIFYASDRVCTHAYVDLTGGF